MNAAQLHLLVNHIPVFGLFIGTVVLLWGLLGKQVAVRQTGLVILLLAGLGEIAAHLSGEELEHQVVALGLNDDLVEAHEHAAKTAHLWSLITAAVSAVALWLSVKRITAAAIVCWLAFAVASVGFGLAARAAHTGGLIKHPEISNSTTIIIPMRHPIGSIPTT